MSGFSLKLDPEPVTRPVIDEGCAEPARPDVRWGEITRAIRNGDNASFQILYDYYFEELFRQIKHLAARDEATCLDIVQETMMKIIRSMKPIESQTHLAAWVRTVARTTTYDWLRREVRHTKNRASLPQQDETAEEPDRVAIDDEARLIWLEEQLVSLPAETRKMIALKYRLGWTLKQISQNLGLKTGAVDGRIRRAVEQIKKQAEQDYTDVP